MNYTVYLVHTSLYMIYYMPYNFKMEKKLEI